MSQQLHVTTWGIEPYSAEDLSANPGSVIARTPHIVSEFIVNPHLGGTVVTGNQPDSGAGTSLLGDLAEWKDTIEDISAPSILELAEHIAGDSSLAAMIPDAGNFHTLLGIPEDKDGFLFNPAVPTNRYSTEESMV